MISPGSSFDPPRPRTPRFNMPFELGLAVANHKRTKDGKRQWFVCEARHLRLLKSLSDLNGTDPYIHNGKIVREFRELCNIFAKPDRQPTVQQMGQIYREMRRNLPAIVRKAAIHGVFFFFFVAFTRSAYC